MSGTIAPINLATIAAGTGGFVIHGQDGYDRSGFSVASAGDINGDGFADLIIGAPSGDAAGNAKSNAGDSYVVFGKASGWGAAIDLATIAAGTGGFVIHGQDGSDYSGTSVASAGDINGDGFADLVIGAYGGAAAGNAKAGAGDSYVVFGKASGWGAAIDLATIAAGTGGFVIHGQDGSDYSGFSVASAGDINGDGFADLIIGAYRADAANNAKGYAGDSYVVFGKASGWGATIDLTNIAAGTGGFVIHGQDNSDRSGRSVASAGDINGDGFDDLIIGAHNGRAAGNAKSDAGDSYVVFGKASGWGAAINLATIAAGTGGFVIHGQDVSDYSGRSVASAGDINGDGFADLVIGANGADAAGNAKIVAGDSYVVFGKASGWGAAIDLTTIAAGAGGFVIHGQDARDYTGMSVASAGDINGDGFADLIIGATGGDAAGNAIGKAGDSYVVFGKASGWGAPIDLATIAAGTGGFVIHGLGGLDYSGTSVASAGDINGDGFADLIIGAKEGVALSGAPQDNAGDSYVIFGRDFTNTVTHAGTASAEVLTGTNAANVMLGGLGNDTLDGLGGADALKGGAGDDRVQIADLAFLNIDGGTGTDTLALTGSGITLNLASIADTKLQSIEAIDLGAGGNTLRLTALEVRNLSDTSNTLRVTGGTGASVSFDDTGWVQGATSDGFVSFTNGSATVIAAESLVPVVSGPTPGSDTLTGSTGNDTINLLAGNDSYLGLDGADSILGNDGNDTIDGGNGADTMNGGTGSDSLLAGAGTGDSLLGDAGNDTLVAGGGDIQRLYGGADADSLQGGNGVSQELYGEAGNDTLVAGGGINQQLYGNDGADSLQGGNGDEMLLGGNGNDTLDGSLGNDTLVAGNGVDQELYGGAGDDRIQIADLAFLNIDGGSGTDTLALTGSGLTLNLASIGDTKLQDIEAIDLGAGGNTLRLTALEVRNLSDTSNTLRVTGGTGATVQFDDTGWVQGATSGGFVTFTNGAATVLVAESLLGPPALAPIDLTTIAAGTGGFVIHGQDGSDNAGFSVASAGDINGDGFADLIIGAPRGDAAGNVKGDAGDSYVVFGKASGWGAAIDLTTIAAGTGGFVIHGQGADDRSGFSVASAGDINGDGFADLIIGAYRGDAAGNAKIGAGDSYVVFGKASGWGAAIDLTTIAAGTGGFVIHGQDVSDYSGTSVASAGDINGDGFADLIIGAKNGDAAGNAKAFAGDSYVVFGKASGWGAAIDLATIAAGTGGFVIHGQDAYDQSGYSVASAGDINGDGFADLIIGANGADAAGNAKIVAGDSYVVFGKASGWGAAIDLATIAAGTGGFVIHGQDGDDFSGASVASAGDINGDGFADLIIGAGYGDAAGNAKSYAGDSYVVFGKASGWGAAIDLATIAAGTGGFVIHGQDRYDQSGRSVASAGDINGDGFADLIIGARYGDGTSTGVNDNRGDSYVVFGKASGWGAAIDLTTIAAGTGGFVIHGQDGSDRSGTSVASAGDINGDGFADLIIGAAEGNAAGNSKNGAGDSYVIFGRDFTNTVTHAGTASAEVLTGTNAANVMVAGLGNDTLDGLGGADALKGGAGDDRIQIADLAFLNIDGGTGTDTLALTGSGITLNLASIADTKLQDIEAIDLGAGGNTLRLTALEVLNLSDTTNTLRVTGATGASIQFDDTGWVQGATTGGFTSFTNGAASVIFADGSDTIVGGVGSNQTLSGGEYDDRLVAGNGLGQFLVGDVGNDTLVGGEGRNQEAYGGNGGDSLNGGSGAGQQLYGEAGNDSLLAGSGSNQWLFGGDDADRLNGGSGAGQQLHGEAGNDTLLAGGGSNQWLFGGDDADRLNGGSGAGQQLYGEAGNDTLLAGGGSNQWLFGGDAADSLNGGSGAGQQLYGEAGNDTLLAGSGTRQEAYGGDGGDRLNGGSGTAQELYGEAGNDTLIAGTGNEQILFGGEGADSLVGGSGPNQSLYGEAGDDTLVAGTGSNQTLYGGGGSDSLVGSEGTSWVSYAFAGEAVTVDLAAGRSFGADGKDSLMGIEAAQGGSFADYLVSGPGGDQTLMGNAGNDTLIGGGAGDHLSGGAGDDVILTGTTTLADIYALFAT